MKNELSYLKKLKMPEVTTSMLIGALSDYEDVRGKINSLNKKGLIKPIKQGVYLINNELGLRPYSKEILANLIYGPSYISLETALSNYGFIPERVTSTTSVCFGRGKKFSTPVGQFDYHHIKSSLYSMGVSLKEISNGAFCLYATPEKALLDFIHIKESKKEFKNQKDYFKYILESYRLDLMTIEDEISLKLQSLSEMYPFQHTHWFANELTRKLLK
jgi:phage terminase large subunit-like protein